MIDFFVTGQYHDAGLDEQPDPNHEDAEELYPRQPSPEDRDGEQGAPDHVGRLEDLVSAGVAGQDEADVAQDLGTEVQQGRGVEDEDVERNLVVFIFTRGDYLNMDLTLESTTRSC